MMKMETKKEYRKNLRDMIRKDLKDHVLTIEHNLDGLKAFYCGRPNTSMFSFRVVFAPGTIAIFGDIGDGIFSINDEDSLAWLRGISTDQGVFSDYIISKLIHKKRQFFPQEAENYLDYLSKEYPEFKEIAKEIREDWGPFCTSSYMDQNHFMDVWVENTNDEPPNACDWGPEAYWLFHALVKVVELYSDQKNKNSVETNSNELDQN